MIKILSLKVRSFSKDHLDLFWEIDNTGDRRERYAIYVERSTDGPEGPWAILAGPLPGNDQQFRDPIVNLFHNWRRYFYRIRVFDKDTGQEDYSQVQTNDPDPDLIALELRRRFEFVMEEFAGRKVLVFPIITTGFRCPSCYETNSRGRTIGRSTTQNCQTCYDTTFAGGYQSPIIAHMQIDPAPSAVQRSDTFELNRQDTTSRLSAFPPVKPKDMIVEAENIRWEVQSVSSTKKGRAVVHQSPILHRIPASDIRYKIPVKLDILMNFSPEREFNRPMSLPSEENQGQEPLSYFLDRLIGNDE